MSTQLNKKYGLLTAICTVVGTVIGSGVFFKAETILKATGGNLPVGILAWIIGGVVMVSCAFAFSILATKHEKVSGVIDYAEALVGKKYSYFIGWFLAVLYYPTLTSVLAWVSARYLCVLLDWNISGPQCMAFAGVLLIVVFAMNALAPKIAGKFQVSATFIKLIPLFLMAIVGTIKGLSGEKLLIENFTTIVNDIPVSEGLFRAVVATAFAYEGWICATAINAELKDAKKNLPKALVIGTMIIVAVYIVYYIGLAGGITNQEMMDGGEAGAKIAFSAVFSNVFGTLLFVFVVISCLGTLNGLTLGCSRAIYSIASRNMGPKPRIFKQIDSETNMPTNSAFFGLVISSLWLLYFYGAVITTIPMAYETGDPVNFQSWFGNFSFDSSELPIVTTYAMYIPIFISMFIKGKSFGFIKGRIAPVLAIICSIFMCIAAVFAHKMAVVYYLIVFAVLMVIGAFFMNGNKKNAK